MEITDIRIKPVNTEGKLRAYVTVTFDDCFVVHNLKVIAGQSGMFIAMPNRKTKTGEYKDIAHPINSEFRQKMQDRIIEELKKVESEPKNAGEEGFDGTEDDEEM